MEYQSILAILLAIVYRSSILGVEPDKQLISGMLSDIVINGSVSGNPESDRVESIKLIIYEIMESDQVKPYDITHLTNRVNLALTTDEIWADSLTESLIDNNAEETQGRLDKDIATIYHMRKQERIAKVLKDATYKLATGKVEYGEILTYAKETILGLEDVVTEYSEQDEAIVSSASTRIEETLYAVFTNADDILTGDMVYKLPFADLNTALQGGLRLTDTMMISALQHHYKSGMSMQIATGIPQINTPMNREKGTPTMARISFEDSLENNFMFMYNEMYHNKHGKAPDMKNKVSPAKRAQMVIERLQCNGWEVEFLRANPSGWTYRDIQQWVDKLEKDYDLDVQVLVLDYLLLIPTTGCITTGPMGTDKRDLLRRMRNWGAARQTAIVTPQQLNTTAKAKQREDIPAKDFLQHIKGCGMYADSGQLDQELDVGILIHRVKHDNEWYLNVVVEKHRTPVVISDTKKATFLRFSSNGMPLLADMITGEKTSVRILKSMTANAFT